MTLLENTIRVGEIRIGKAVTSERFIKYKNKLKIKYDPNFPSDLKRRHVSLVYFICVDGEVYKIGQSSNKCGIEGCLSFYLNAGTDDSGLNRYAINLLIREKIESGSKVEIYMIYKDSIEVEIPTLKSTRKIFVPVSAKGMEEAILQEYNDLFGEFPVWNYQERGTRLPDYIHESFAEYKTKRSMNENTN